MEMCVLLNFTYFLYQAFVNVVLKRTSLGRSYFLKTVLFKMASGIYRIFRLACM